MRFVILPYWSAQRGLANVSDLSAWARTGMHIIVSIIQASLLGGRMSFDIVSVCSCCSFVLSVRVVRSCCPFVLSIRVVLSVRLARSCLSEFLWRRKCRYRGIVLALFRVQYSTP
jgi:hypothetical protein